MDDLTSLLNRPEIAGIYVFGSYLRESDPDDIDILLVYREETCPHSSAYELLSGVFLELQSSFAVPVHLNLLSDTEIVHNDFVNAENCISLTAMLS